MADSPLLLSGRIACAALVMIGCQVQETPSTTPAVDAGAIRLAVRAADSAFAAAAASRDLEASATSLASDGIMFPPDEPLVVGRGAIREYMRRSFAIPGFSVSWTTDTIVVARGGDLAYSFARSRYTFPSRSGVAGAIDTAYGKGMSVWRKDTDGRWRAVADIWNGAPELPPIHPAGASD